MATKVIADVLAEAGTSVVHGEDNAHDGEVRILASLFDSFHQIENFTNPFQSEVFALDGYENLFCSDEGASHEEADAGRAVEDDQIKGGIEPKGIEGFSDVGEGIVHSR